MKERPILMTPENAQKCFEGVKTQTRRIINPQPPGRIFEKYGFWYNANFEGEWVCKFGEVGDRLWIREACWIWGTWVHEEDGWHFHEHHSKQVSCDIIDPALVGTRGDTEPRWIRRPGIFMPRWACRTVVEIMEIRVQRLWEIGESDARAEGITKTHCPDWHAIADFMALWESINGPGSWAENPWVFAISFRRIDK